MSSGRRSSSADAVVADDTVADGRELATQTTAVLGPRAKPLELAAGTHIGRYVVVERLGRGGMGVVYKARDPELDRFVAIKLLRLKARPGAEGSSQRARLLREAQAMAQLSHPNVISVFDAGEFNGAVFLAMELVQGVSLRTWLRSESRDWREVVAVMLQAGRGLAAAHEHRLVHRDFKPDNVMIGEDGRVCVIDFGLARHVDGELDPDAFAFSEDSEDSTRSERLLDTPLTKLGDVVGTPKYMPPEQLAGQAVDARTDQFSYCVTLFEGLYGERPFRGDTTEALLAAMCDEPFEVPDAKGIPGWLQKLVARGLSAEPDDRFAHMRALLAELSRDHARRRRLALVAAAFVVAVAGTTFALSSRHAAEPCTTAASQLADVWGAGHAARIDAAFIATEHVQASPTAERVARALDDYARDWVGMRTEACKATYVHGAQSEKLLDLRNACLDRRRSQLGSLVQLLETTTEADVVERGVQAVRGLPPLSPCADAESLTAVVELPADADRRKGIAEARALLDRAHALEAAGSFESGLELANQVVDGARALGYAPLLAEALYRQGGLLDKAGKTADAEVSWYEAAHVATVSRDDRTAARAWIDLLWSVGFRQSRYAEAMVMFRVAEATVERVGDPVLRAHLRGTLGAVYISKGSFDDAIAELTQTLAARETLLGPNDLATANTLDALSYAYEQVGRLNEARDYAERALAIRATSLGPDHLDVAFALTNLGEVHLALHAFDAAAEHASRALAIREARLGKHHPSLGVPLGTLAMVALERGDDVKAEALLRRAIAIFDEHVAPNHIATATYYARLGDVFERREQWELAIEVYARVVEIITASVGEEHPQVVIVLTGMGASQLSAGRRAEAVATLERAVTLSKGEDVSAHARADAAFALARALWKTDKPRSRTLASEAKAAYAAGTAPDVVRERRVIDDWVATH